MLKIANKQDLLMIKLTKFFFIKSNLDVMLPVINGESKLSLRIIDWFVNNYSKKNNISFIKDDNNEYQKQFIVYLNYKKQLKAYSKKQFDPFCRRNRINFFYNKNESIITTVGQLNFFRWAIENNIISYIKEKLKDIELDMYNSLRNIKRKKDKKRHELSVSATKKLNKHNVKIIIKFE